jgi:hypothetical protein
VETQAVTLDSEGRYAVVLGATKPEGLPLELFSNGSARWLGVHVEGLADAPRVLLVSVPYALKAADADTVGGKPLSAFVLAGDKTGTGADGLTYVDARVLRNGFSGAPPPPQGAGSAGYLGMFQDATTLVNSVMFQNGTSIGVGTTTPAAAFHSVASAAPGAFFDVYSNALGALPVVFRAARGTPQAPSAVQTDDILGGVAVRAYGATGFSAGQGQVMFKAAEPWTDAAHGTYLSMTTTPLGSSFWTERVRITPEGNVGIGTPTPGQRLSVAGTIESTTGGFKFPDGTMQVTGATSTGAGSGFGVHALSFNTGAGNSAFGFWGLGANTTGSFNSAFGHESLYANQTGAYNSAFGSWSLRSNGIGSNNSAFGFSALFTNWSGSNNSAFGYLSLYSNQTGDDNSAFGFGSLRHNDGSDNSAFGYLSQYLGSGTGNSAFGSESLYGNQTGINNSAFGYLSLYSNQTGSINSAFGSQSLPVNETGSHNTAIGSGSLLENTSGSYNTAVGDLAGSCNDSGHHNTFIGSDAGPAGFGCIAAYGALTYAGAIGAGAEVTQSNSLALGGVAGSGYEVKVGIGTSAPNTTLQVVGDIRVGTSGTNGCLMDFGGGAIAGSCSSDARLKRDVRPFGPVLGRVARLQPVHFTWRTEEFPEYHFGTGLNSGLIAQDVEKVFPELVGDDGRGHKTVNYSEVPLVTLQAVRELTAENEVLKAQLAALEARLMKLERQRQ